MKLRKFYDKWCSNGGTFHVTTITVQDLFEILNSEKTVVDLLSEYDDANEFTYDIKPFPDEDDDYLLGVVMVGESK